tara:strand:+ start:355 stop:1119 length:765 start_codon:yes stop_codon:yes gene_type:complete
MFYSKKLNQFNNIKHCFFSKNNGYSEGIYKSLNCGPGSKDKRENVIKNLNLVSKKMGIKKEELILMHQTHSNNVIIIDEKNKKNKKLVADALVTKLEGVALGVLTADCAPIILYDEINQIIGCIHAGWKGAHSGIIENTLKKFKEINKNNKITASIGPCIGNKNYEVDLEFYEIFLKDSKINKKFFSRKDSNKFLFNIRGYVNNKLSDLGVLSIDNINADTFKDEDNFFSYRRSKKLGEPDYGRCISTISLVKN